MSSSAPGFARVARSVALAALLVAVGNAASRLLGLGRESAIAAYFARGTAVDAFTLAWTVPNQVYDLLINGAVSAALVPVLSEYAEGDQDEFWRIVASIFNLALLALLLLIGLLFWQAPAIVARLAQSPALEALTITLVRTLLPAVLLMALSGLTTAVLYARRTFLLPAFTGAIFNLGMILGVVVLHNQLGVASLAVGASIGALGQVLVQAPGLRGWRYRPILEWNHPAVRRIVLLYAPVALGIGFSMIGTLVDRWLASGYVAALSTMRYATTLIQFPLGLVATAVSVAVLPTLSRQDAANDQAAFRATLAMGLKVVLLLVVPATAGMAVLVLPITRLLFERGAFAGADSVATSTALLYYLPGMPAAALDQVLLFALYARRRTLAPNLVQGAAIGFYLGAALLLLRFTQLGFLALVVGNSVQWIVHALIMFLLVRRHLSFRGLRLGEAIIKTTSASLLMALALFPLVAPLAPFPVLIQVAVLGTLGLLVYLLLCLCLRVEALGFFWAAVAGRLRKK